MPTCHLHSRAQNHSCLKYAGRIIFLSIVGVFFAAGLVGAIIIIPGYRPSAFTITSLYVHFANTVSLLRHMAHCLHHRSFTLSLILILFWRIKGVEVATATKSLKVKRMIDFTEKLLGDIHRLSGNRFLMCYTPDRSTRPFTKGTVNYLKFR